MRIAIDNEQPTKVLSLSDARNKYRADKCRHTSLVVDEEKAEVECGDCGEKLNAVSVLARFANEESRWGRNLLAVREARAELEKRIRCKCQHCGSMTRIRI